MRYVLLLLCLAMPPVWAATDTGNVPVPDGAPGEGDDAPAVTIKPSGQGQVEEFRSNGKLYMLKVTPRKGVAYYLIDPHGDGRFERQETLPDLRPPLWTVKEF